MSSATLSAALQPIEAGLAGFDEGSLTRAFASFTEAASSLERSYVELQGELMRLRHELEDTNRDLASSLEENRRLEREHEELRRRQALAEMSALLAHEIRNPLGSLELFAGLLAESELEDEERQWVGHLQAGLRTLAATVNNVLHFHSQPSPGLAPTDLGQWLRSSYDFLRPLAERARVRMALVQELDGVQASADRHRLEQVLLNLALNAFRFMPEGGSLKISGHVGSRSGKPIAAIEISDSGLGIAIADRERIFDPGFTTSAGSPGLGLAVCKRIVEQHSGAISLNPSPAAGTTFRLEFPLSGANP